jgi:uncharacterized protein
MKIAIFSDTHDNLPNIYQAIDYIKKQGCEALIHCGDVCAPSVMVEIANKWDGPMHLVYGNVDGDRELMEQKAKDLPNLKIYGEQGEIELGGKKIGWVHYPDVAQEMAESGKYDAVFYGHDHKAWEKKVGTCTLRNPGTLAGLFAKPTFAIYDTETNQAQLILIEKI